ncbi:hypothetical protein TSTA_096610 [Talaromyces stipitatus ATCC 10500]|uniref:Uncharacterized protein n=1 Tax=Talaromyces stipitatus (strain ATCC 10500 / CBS 375.48 / QM 6759 / NRRL 1006) TaxID=441959 RepID=B8M3P0_TALSN|nr:uncharacterized protein TSTA_096610 [Talaromyces stipitatus ATCC 10500]EED22412.1 hypothetical protein TSTA_096610 [Talaromyces stipitatus ATCC 10500]
MKDQEIDHQNDKSRDLQSSLSNALKLNTLLFKIRDDELPMACCQLAHEVKCIELGVLRTADLFASHLFPLAELKSSIKIHPDLDDIVRKSIKRVNILSSMPGPALRAMIFHFIRDHILYSETWTAHHIEGYMLRAYQRTDQRSVAGKHFENFHRLAPIQMLEHDSEFKTSFLDAYNEELQSHIMRLLDSLFDPIQLDKKAKTFTGN